MQQHVLPRSLLNGKHALALATPQNTFELSAMSSLRSAPCRHVGAGLRCPGFEGWNIYGHSPRSPLIDLATRCPSPSLAISCRQWVSKEGEESQLSEYGCSFRTSGFVRPFGIGSMGTTTVTPSISGTSQNPPYLTTPTVSLRRRAELDGGLDGKMCIGRG